ARAIPARTRRPRCGRAAGLAPARTRAECGLSRNPAVLHAAAGSGPAVDGGSEATCSGGRTGSRGRGGPPRLQVRNKKKESRIKNSCYRSQRRESRILDSDQPYFKSASKLP